jgi:isoleucyl-tRNA synthetase
MSDNKKNYRKTLNLPGTSFSMKANLTQKEPQLQKNWDKMDVYNSTRKACQGKPLYVLHDGPPYANGDIHMGHVINKVLKDIVVKYKTMTGFDAPYVPGWDCHGLPIEVKVMAELGEKAKGMSKPQIRDLCKKYASKYVRLQSKQFKSLGVFADYDNPYLTMIPAYEKNILEVFSKLVERGLVYKQLKPIHWSIGCETALADAELEYKDIPSPSIHVNFPLEQASKAKAAELGLARSAEDNISLMIWTTTPWTLAANLAVAAHPRIEYRSISYEKNGRKTVSIIAADRVAAVMAAGGLDNSSCRVSEAKVAGEQLEGMRYKHPYVPANPTEKDAYMVIAADYVTTEDGTGLVHIAPGHGVDDYLAGMKYGLEIYSPVLADGSYDETVPDFIKGRSVLKVDPVVIEKLEELGALFAKSQFMHSYPHCWRSGMPVIFRATEQWFVSVDREIEDYGKSLRQMSLDSTPEVEWIPSWGEKRIRGMLESRPDWCISRQRVWGLPIPAFYNSQGQTLMNAQTLAATAEHIGKKGSDSWFTDSPRQILGEDFKLPEGFSWDDLYKEENIFDVWFESGCSWYNVTQRCGWPVPVDLYLEGSDQHRGWFQLSLLPALGAVGKAPFKKVLTHGFTVDSEGRKQSKSLGNYVNAQEEAQKYGADILRLWVSSVNYQEDMRCSDELIGRLQDAYRKIRNTLRYLMGNTSDLAPSEKVAYDDMLALDKWAYQRYLKLIKDVRDSYESFNFHKVFNLLYNFCTVDMSNIYLDVLKDRLYCDAAKSLSRRSAQTAMSEILSGLVRMLAPVLVHTAEEAWGSLGNDETVHLAQIPETAETDIDFNLLERWESVFNVRDEVLRCLEGLRQKQEIASNQEADIAVKVSDKVAYEALEMLGEEGFAMLCIVSGAKFEFAEGGDTAVFAAKSANLRCERCWNHRSSVGSIDVYPELCQRCADVVSQFEPV